MLAERVGRTRTVEYTITYLQRKKELYIYVGSTWVGRIIKRIEDPLHKETHFAGYLQLPGCWGPVSRAPTVHEVKIEVTAAIRGWLATLSATPTDPEERPEKETQNGRVRRTRAAPTPYIVPTRVRRTR
jgi:hypothetical protein